MTETRSSSTSSRSTVPAMTRPSGKVAASGASPSEPGPNNAAKRASDRIPQTCVDDLRRASPRRRRPPSARASDRAAPARPAARPPASRSSSWWIQVPRSAAARIASLGGGAASSSTAIARRRERPRRTRFGRRRRRAPTPAMAGGLQSRACPRFTLRPCAVLDPRYDATWPSPGRRPIARHRLLDDPVPALGRPRIRAVLPLRFGSTPADDQPVGGAGQRDVEQAPMLLEVALPPRHDDLVERRANARPSSAAAAARCRRRRPRVERSIGVRPSLAGSAVASARMTTGASSPLAPCTVITRTSFARWPGRAGRRRRRARTRRGSGRARRSRCARIRARCSSARRSDRAPPCRGGE